MANRVGTAKVHGDMYQMFVEEFRHKHDMGGSDVEGQWEAVKEEMDELIQAVEDDDSDDDIEEECVDVLFTIFLFGELMCYNLRRGYMRKASYNLQKSTSRDENGKVTDDV